MKDIKLKLADEIINIFFNAGAVVNKERFNMVLEALDRIESETRKEIRKMIEGKKTKKGCIPLGKREPSDPWNEGLDSILSLLNTKESENK